MIIFYRNVSFVIIFIIMISIGSFASAAENSLWDQDKVRLEKLYALEISNEERCKNAWDILWPHANDGNLDARARILIDIYLGGRRLPGDDGDDVTRLRNTIILAVHSVGAGGNLPISENSTREYISGLYTAIEKAGALLNPNGGYINGRAFFKCASEKWDKECADLAVRDNFVPSYKSFSEQLDWFSKQGKPSFCVPIGK